MLVDLHFTLDHFLMLDLCSGINVRISRNFLYSRIFMNICVSLYSISFNIQLYIFSKKFNLIFAMIFTCSHSQRFQNFKGSIGFPLFPRISQHSTIYNMQFNFSRLPKVWKQTGHATYYIVQQSVYKLIDLIQVIISIFHSNQLILLCWSF